MCKESAIFCEAQPPASFKIKYVVVTVVGWGVANEGESAHSEL